MEKEKFISVIKENQKLIYKVCNSYCSNTDNRKDLEQEILVQLWQSFKKFDGRIKLSTWIYKIALNTAISFYRRNGKHNNNRVKLDALIISLQNFEDNSEQSELISTLYRFIEKLNGLDKALILLYLDNKKHKEIAETLGISETNVATKISRIKKTLREQFDKI